MKVREIIGNALRKYLSSPFKLARLNYLASKQFFSKQRYLITRSEASYMGDHIATIHYVAFLHDKKFNSAYNDAFMLADGITAQTKNKFSMIRSLDISWRAHIVTWAATQAIKLDGDFVECGVSWGFLSKTICEYTDFETHTDKTFYLIDTWGDPNNKDLNHPWYQEDVYCKVKERFSKYHNVKLVRGHVPEILSSIPVKKIAYLSIDMNGHIAERKTLEAYYEMIVPGGIIYLDDYGWSFPKLRETVDEFFKDKPESLLHFPSGNSIVVKL